jgi:hypothetical protein
VPLPIFDPTQTHRPQPALPPPQDVNHRRGATPPTSSPGGIDGAPNSAPSQTTTSSAPVGDAPVQSSYGPKVGNMVMSEAERNNRYYQGGQPNAQSFFGSSTNVKSEQVVKDMIGAVKDHWDAVDPTVRNLFESGKADSFFGDNRPPGFDKMSGQQKASAYLVGKSAFETANQFDPNHKDPGNQAWGLLSHYNKDSNFKDYGLSTDLRGSQAKQALTTPGYAAIADLNTLKQGFELQQPGNKFTSAQWLDRAHMTFVGVGKGIGEYNRQKQIFQDNVFNSSPDLARAIGATSIFDLVNSIG